MKRLWFGALLLILLLVISLSGCNWLGKGILNVVNPESEIRMSYSINQPSSPYEDKYELLRALTFDLVVYPLNQVGFTITELKYRYHEEEKVIDDLSKDFELYYYVPPNRVLDPNYESFPNPGEGPIPGEGDFPFVIENLPLVFQDGIDYLWKNFKIKNLYLDLTAQIVDDAGHFLEKKVIVNFPVLQMGEDFWPPTVEIEGPTTANVGQAVTFIAQAKDEHLIASYRWLVNGASCGCGGGSATGAVFTYTFTEAGTYTVVVEVKDYSGNAGYGSISVTVT